MCVGHTCRGERHTLTRVGHPHGCSTTTHPHTRAMDTPHTWAVDTPTTRVLDKNTFTYTGGGKGHLGYEYMGRVPRKHERRTHHELGRDVALPEREHALLSRDGLERVHHVLVLGTRPC